MCINKFVGSLALALTDDARKKLSKFGRTFRDMFFFFYLLSVSSSDAEVWFGSVL